MNLSNYVDHTVLKPEATSAAVEKICAEAIEYGFASVCVNPCHVAAVSKALSGSTVKTCTVIGFPLGANTSRVKALETQDAIDNGADEVDMVINIGAVKDGNDALVLQDICAVVNAAKGKALTKVIIETCLLTDEEKARVCRLAVEAGADFVKTSTGFSTGGATEADVTLMKNAVAGKAKVKASGGVRTKESALAMVAAGADRIGTSNGVAFMQE